MYMYISIITLGMYIPCSAGRLYILRGSREWSREEVATLLVCVVEVAGKTLGWES